MLSVADLKTCPGTKEKTSCGRKVRLTRAESGAPLAVDPTPHPDGNTAVWRDVHGVLRSRRITPDRPLSPPEKRMMPHAATCTGVPRVKTPPPPPPRPPKTTPPAGHLYVLLGLTKAASQDDIKRAYRRLARQLHPDINADQKVVEHFKAIGEAYHVLSDPGRRAAYDATGQAPRPR
ncbi:DnaJ domain-containing protein [Microtetraspora malaysiensis]|uniref:DnaJ domain-containing protein n=1 Tax=Microtetraspora malaysiensis TaxID=161358 RepID=UPI003D8FC5CD